MSFEDFYKDPKSWIAAAMLAIGGLWKYVIGRRKNKAETIRTEAEKNAMEFNLMVSKEKWAEEKELKFVEKIDALIERLDIVEAKNEELQRLLNAEKENTKELRAELNMYKTIKSTLLNQPKK